MTNPTMTLLEYLGKIGVDLEGDFLNEGARLLAQLAIELEAEEVIGASRYERSQNRKAYRNGHRERVWETRVGEIPLRIPKLREGTYFPSLLEPRKRSEKALLSVVQTAYVKGVSTRKVDDLLRAMGLTRFDKSKVSRICKELDELVEAFRNRTLDIGYPYMWLDALYFKVRQNHRIVSQAMVIAIGVRETGERDILGFSLGASETYAFWMDFLRSLVRRGLKGVELVTSDAHEGLKAAIEEALPGAAWQRCRVHFMRNVLAHIPKGSKSVVAAALRTIFAQPDREAAGQQLAEVVKVMEPRWPKAAKILQEGEDDILTYMDFPPEHWTRIYSTNPLERLNKEVKRRTNVVGIFPDEPSVLRLVGSVLMETADEWEVGRRYFSQESMRKLTDPDPTLVSEVAALRLAPVH